MKALCPKCGFHHEVVRVLEDGHGENRRDVYQVSPNGECLQTWLSEQDILEARARFEQEALLQDEDDL
ncbi:MAG: hypothetical protein IPK82_09615 [Polyangiaceae bacterium]|nr:hypothetical protein [Polyangiaceae bacterium]